MISEKSSTLGSAVGWVKRHRRATHQGALGTLNLNWICALNNQDIPVISLNGFIARFNEQSNLRKNRPFCFIGSSGNFVGRESGFLVLSNAVLVLLLVLEAPKFQRFFSSTSTIS